MSKLGKVLAIVGGIDVGLTLGGIAFIGGCIFTMALIEKAKEEKKNEQESSIGEERAKKVEEKRSEANKLKELAIKLFEFGYPAADIANILNVEEATVVNMVLNEGDTE